MQALKNAVEKHKQLILDTERYIWNNPETGYKEYKTNKYLEDAFEALGYSLVKAGDIPGFYTVLDTGKAGPEILIFGEMDSVICPEHPESDKQTGAVHSCGHNAQCAALLGIAAALKEPGVSDGLCGRIRLCAVPAEELLEIDFRRDLCDKGIIKYLGGKTEFLRRGYFDGVDMAFMVHAEKEFKIMDGWVGFLTKSVIYKGKAAHAGISPWEGNNALYAATCGLNAVNAVRETFCEQDVVRVHPIITHGGDMVNAVPEKVKIESYIRGASFDAMIETNKKVNRALCGAALSLGTNIEIIDLPGYAPLKNDRNLKELVVTAAATALPHRKFNVIKGIRSGSTDLGDLSGLMPVVHPFAAGAVGTAHGSDYYITDPEQCCVENALLQLTMLKMLLSDNAKKAYEIIDDFKPDFASKQEYLDFIDSLCCSGDRITYNADGTAKVNIK